MEIIKGINFLDPGFYIPVLIGLLLFIIVVKVAKKLVKLAVFIGVVLLAAVLFFNMPSFKVEGAAATIKIKGQEYTVDARDIKIQTENADGRDKVFMVSGSTRIELPFSKDFAKKFILDRINPQSSSAE